jgi:hypothetical protein
MAYHHWRSSIFHYKSPSKQGCNTRKHLGFADHLAACHVMMRETTAAFWPMGKFDVVALHLSGNFVFRENGIFV